MKLENKDNDELDIGQNLHSIYIYYNTPMTSIICRINLTKITFIVNFFRRRTP